MIRAVMLLTVLLYAATLPSATLAQAYPSKPVRMVVPYPTGGGIDILARQLAQRLSPAWGQPVVVENRPGASGNIATETVIRAPADGATLLLCGAVNTVNATLLDTGNFNFVRDVAPIGGAVRFANVLTVNAAFPARTMAEFIAYAKAHPGTLNQGSSGIGTTQHLAGELFQTMTGIGLTHIPYKGASPALVDLLGGHVEVLFESLPASIQHIKSGQLRALAVTTAVRSEILPDVPTVAEFVPGYEASGWSGLCAPRNTPADIIEALNGALNACLAEPRMKASIMELGAASLAGSSVAFGGLIAEETEKWAKVIRDGHIKPG